jgi:transcriptional regulator GlxA family with amidase domain
MGIGRLGRRRHDHRARLQRGRRTPAARGARIASICSGAFTLAATGLLDGLGATTHWIAADRLATMFPKVDVRPDVLYVDNGNCSPRRALQPDWTCACT